MRKAGAIAVGAYALLLIVCLPIICPALHQLPLMLLPLPPRLYPSPISAESLFIVLILYPLLAFALEPLYMDLFRFFRYPEKPGEVPAFIPIGWGALIAITLISSRWLNAPCGVPPIVLTLVLGAAFGIVVEKAGTKCKVWEYDRGRLEELRKERRIYHCLFKPMACLNYTPVVHVCGYPLLSLCGYLTCAIYELGRGLLPLHDVWQMTFHLILAWASGLAVWFFGLYSFAEREVSGAIERLKELKKMIEEEKLKDEKVELAIEAQETAIRGLMGLRRLIVIHAPGMVVGLIAPMFMLLITLASCGILALSLGGLLALFLATLMSLVALSIVGAAILVHAFRKRPEAKYLDVLLEHINGTGSKLQLLQRSRETWSRWSRRRFTSTR